MGFQSRPLKTWSDGVTKHEEELQQVKDLVKKGRVLCSKETIEQAIAKVASEMNSQLDGKEPIFLCVMNGALVFMGQLLTHLNFPLQVNYIHVTRYQGEIEGSQLFWRAEPTIDLKDRVVVVVEDILDTGLTLSAIQKYCDQKGAKEIFTATLVDKNRPREPGGTERCDFTGLNIDNKFIYGYGMDYKEYLRNVDAIYAVEE